MTTSNRMISDMTSVLKNPGNAKGNQVLYTMNRDMYNLGALRYDITEMPPLKIGEEFAKTLGHYHIGPDPELYEILEGHAYFLFQKYEEDPAIIKEVYIVEALAGEKVAILPHFGHFLINVGNALLKTANWVSEVKYDYETVKKLRGACYYILDKGQNIEFEKNPNYKFVPDLIKLRPKEAPEFGLEKKIPAANLRGDEKEGLKKLDWLLNPNKYLDSLKIDKFYKRI
ncbi:glucose-6-phosphate isomerase [Candidatus Giovannonibacteria bacterium]|nr:glucose-6-phosphate isomerase [Candidatus Giovannonibacteria bacterium]